MNTYIFENFRTRETIVITAYSLFESKFNKPSAQEQLKDKLFKERRFDDIAHFRYRREEQ